MESGTSGGRRLVLILLLVLENRVSIEDELVDEDEDDFLRWLHI